MKPSSTVGLGIASLLFALPGAGADANAAAVPLALRGVNPRFLSGGMFSALDASGAFGNHPRPVAAAAGAVDRSKGIPPAVLDPGVGTNQRLGADPAALPAGQTAQAEPHITRSAADSSVVLATFQEGRFASDGGSLDCGYALSTDGGFTWSRALIPQLTVSSGGTFLRATDPVAAIGPQGDLYLSTLASVDSAFGTAALVVSRSADRGLTWSAPLTVYRQTSALASPDKDWLAVNDFPGSPNVGRLVATWTNFTSDTRGNATGNNLLAAVSDDRGTSWSSPISITPTGALNQGSLPLFLPDGSLAVVYITFANASTETLFSIQCKRSTNGGLTYPTVATTAVANVNGWADPVLRSGVFLPAAAVARTTGDIFVCYAAVVAGSPRVMVVKSSNQGTTWTAPAVVSDNPAGVSVDNPAVAVTPDGQTVSVFFMDKRNAADGLNYIDQYVAHSFDGGATWQPNLRVTEMSSDVRYAPLTSEGYMLGDYLAIAPSLSSDEPCVPIWCDTRSGDADPFVALVLPAAAPDYNTWAIVHRTSRGVTPFLNDTDGDGYSDYLEYLEGTVPEQPKAGESLFLRLTSPTTLDILWLERIGVTKITAGSITEGISTTGPSRLSQPNPFGLTSTAVANLPADQFPSVSLRPGLAWQGVRLTNPAGVALAVARSTRYSAGLPSAIMGPPATIGSDSRLINLSTRGQIKTGASQLLVGFVVDGEKSVLVRAAGPALAGFGLSGTLADPQLTLVSGAPPAPVLASNDDWQAGSATAALFARLGAFSFAPGSLDAALVQTLPASSYSALASGSNGTTGLGLVEAYDADPTPGSPSGPRLVNLSTRGEVGAGANALIAGFVITGTQPRRILLRAVGPTLANFGVSGVLADPVLTLFQGPTLLATNDDWEISRSPGVVAATAQRLGAFALNPASLDSSLLLTLAPGAYTAVVTGANGTTGLALVEIYDAD